MIAIETLQALCNNSIVFTNHALVKMKERGITSYDIEAAILSGEIIAQYEDDKPYPSCLIFGFTSSNKPIHAVVSINENTLWVITSYFPSLDIWENDYKTRKGAV